MKTAATIYSGIGSSCFGYNVKQYPDAFKDVYQSLVLILFIPAPLNPQHIKKIKRNLFPELFSLDYGFLHSIVTSGQGYNLAFGIAPDFHAFEFHLPVFMYHRAYRY